MSHHRTGNNYDNVEAYVADVSRLFTRTEDAKFKFPKQFLKETQTIEMMRLSNISELFRGWWIYNRD